METRQCPYCEKKIKGMNSVQIEQLMLIHKISKHREHIKIEETK